MRQELDDCINSPSEGNTCFSLLSPLPGHFVMHSASTVSQTERTECAKVTASVPYFFYWWVWVPWLKDSYRKEGKHLGWVIQSLAAGHTWCGSEQVSNNTAFGDQFFKVVLLVTTFPLFIFLIYCISFSFLTTQKPLAVWTTANYGKFLKNWKGLTTLSTEKPIFIYWFVCLFVWLISIPPIWS